MNKKANSPPPYSILKPETNSDSPSAKSKGARFVSARQVMSHKTNITGKVNALQIKTPELPKSDKSKVNIIKRRAIKTNAILTS